MHRDLNIVTLNIPFPPDYGGMIDSYYRLKWLKDAGVNIHLHCFEYGCHHSPELESLCKTVRYYPRNTSLLNHFSIIPFIVKSRNSANLLENLRSNDFPILFDGLHTTFFLNHPDLRNRKKFVRAHNIEHLYYRSLAEYESNFIKKLYYIIEYHKLKKHEKVIRHANGLFAISVNDYEYFRRNYENSHLIPPFHPYNEIVSMTGKGDYVLFHGDLSVRENSLIAESLIKNVFSKINFNCIITGKNPPGTLLAKAEGKKNIRIESNPGCDKMEKLIKEAHINLLPVVSSNGFKVKLIIALLSGRHCLVNSLAAGFMPGKSVFHIADSEQEIIKKINLIMHEDFTEEMKEERKKILSENFSNSLNAKKLSELILNA